jgi:predicted HTH transcriptional regulator
MELTLHERYAKYGLSDQKVLMDYNWLKDLVKNGENNTIEFKLKANHPEKIVREIVAFANTDGGKLIIGVDDNRQIKGLKFAEDEEFILVRAIEKNCFPPINYVLKNVILNDMREVLVFEIPKSANKPHYVQLALNSLEKTAYVRVKDKSIQASKEVRKYLKGNDTNKNFQFTFGEKEKKLMKYLDENNSITIQDFSKIANIPIWLASKTLVLLALAHVVKIIPGEVMDTFIRIGN